MFTIAKYISNSVSINFERVPEIRRKANSFENLLSDRYSIPQVLPIPDYFEPNAPRLIFESTHGFSQIVISQLNITLNVTYSQDWQINTDLRLNYLHDRSESLFNLLAELGIKATYCGLLTSCVLPSTYDDAQILSKLADSCEYKLPDGEINEVIIKNTSIVDHRYFSHIELSNYRKWPLEAGVIPPQRFVSAKAIERGLSLSGDFNDRFAFNEQNGYFTSLESINSIIDFGTRHVQSNINKILEHA